MCDMPSSVPDTEGLSSWSFFLPHLGILILSELSFSLQQVILSWTPGSGLLQGIEGNLFLIKGRHPTAAMTF